MRTLDANEREATLILEGITCAACVSASPSSSFENSADTAPVAKSPALLKVATCATWSWKRIAPALLILIIAAVALIWLVPDRRVERAMAQS